MRAATPSCCRPSVVDVFAATARRRAGAPPTSGCVVHVARLRDERLLVGIAVRDQRAVGRDDQREAVLADPDLDRPSATFPRG